MFWYLISPSASPLIFLWNVPWRVHPAVGVQHRPLNTTIGLNFTGFFLFLNQHSLPPQHHMLLVLQRTDYRNIVCHFKIIVTRKLSLILSIFLSWLWFNQLFFSQLHMKLSIYVRYICTKKNYILGKILLLSFWQI